MKNESRWVLLRSAIDQWVKSPKCSWAIVASEIVSTMDTLDLTQHYADLGIQFKRSHDIFDDNRINSQKLSRWLGRYEEDQPNHARIFELETLILKTMPEYIKMRYLNSVYCQCDIAVVHIEEAEKTSIAKLGQILNKESYEAIDALLSMNLSPDQAHLDKALKEAKELEAAASITVQTLEDTIGKTL